MNRSSENWHALNVEAIAQLLSSHPEQGLSPFEAQARLEEIGPNEVTPVKVTPMWMKFLLQFHNPLVYILLGSAFITGFLKEWVDASVIFGVTLVNAVIGFIQEARAEKALETLRRSTRTEATVLRDRQPMRVPSRELVPGDVVLLQSGDRVPADLRLFQIRDLRIDESTLTGESVPSAKNLGEIGVDTVLGDRSNMAYGGTLVTYGQARGLVVTTGDHTETGKIAHLIATAEDLTTPLTQKIEAFSTWLLWMILGLAVVTFGIGIARQEPVIEMFMAAVALAVGAIPEGLPAAVTITLAIGVNRMAKRRAIIRRLPAVETLGSTTVICTDKTGTLTENQMTVQHLWSGGQSFTVSGVGYSAPGEVQAASGRTARLESNQALRQTLVCGLLCNDAVFREAEGKRKLTGDPTEGALLIAAYKAGLTPESLGLNRLDAIPFESDRQYMASLHQGEKDKKPHIYIKGALEQILARCSHQLDAAGALQPLNAQEIEQEAGRLAGQGVRVLAFAGSPADAGRTQIAHEDLLHGLHFYGLQGMIDPPREEAKRAIAACREAGIKVKMITGDHALTAAAIAKKLELEKTHPESEEAAKAVTGQQLAKMTDQELIAAAEKTAVFARVAPEQKLRIVYALQAKKQVVAMTGDGVNDAPALKQADIGVAMGITGTEVAKDACDIILTDDNFASIEAAVEEGRGVFDNLTKFIVWTLPTNLGQGLVILAAIFSGAVLPLLPVQILWINMTTAVLLGLVLAFEPKEKGIMTRPPRDPGKPLLTRYLVWRILFVSAILLAGSFYAFNYELAQGASVEKARTMAVNIFVMVQLFYLFNCRSLTQSMFAIGVLSNRWVVAGVGIMLGLQFLFTYAPFMQTAFKSAPLNLGEWGLILLLGLAGYILVGIEKWVANRWGSRRV